MIIGIDPGKYGAIVGREGSRIYFYSVPLTPDKDFDIPALIQVFETLKSYAQKPITVVMESVHARRGEGVVSSFHFGYVNGLLTYGAYTITDNVILVTPTQWKRDLGLTGKDLTYKQRKEISRLYCIEHYPELAEQLKRKKDNDKAEALLLTEWFIRKYKK